MNELPSPKIYEKEFKYMPWGMTIFEIQNYILDHVPMDGSLLDLMCGPGYLLNKIRAKRRDLSLTGVDSDQRYIDYAKCEYKKIDFFCAEVFSWTSSRRFDVIVCTGGLHHLPYSKHQAFLKKIANLLNNGGFCILADPYISSYSNEKERRIAAAELGYEYLKAVIENNAPNDIVSATIDIMYNDILPQGEYKTVTSRIDGFAKNYFSKIELHKVWPVKKSEYGDYYFILNK